MHETPTTLGELSALMVQRLHQRNQLLFAIGRQAATDEALAAQLLEAARARRNPDAFSITADTIHDLMIGVSHDHSDHPGAATSLAELFPEINMEDFFAGKLIDLPAGVVHELPAARSDRAPDLTGERLMAPSGRFLNDGERDILFNNYPSILDLFTNPKIFQWTRREEKRYFPLSELERLVTSFDGRPVTREKAHGALYQQWYQWSDNQPHLDTYKSDAQGRPLMIWEGDLLDFIHDFERRTHSRKMKVQLTAKIINWSEKKPGHTQ